MRSARLIYYVAEELLTGKVGGRRVHLAAKSGFETVGPADMPGAAAGMVLPIPVGNYFIDVPALWQRGDAAQLRPVKPFVPGESAGASNSFRIHAQRVLGAHRSIFLVHLAEFVSLMAGLRTDAGGRLEVRANMEGNYPERWAAQWAEQTKPASDFGAVPVDENRSADEDQTTL